MTITGIPYAIISQRLDTASSVGGFTVIKLTDNSGNITSSSPSVAKQVQDGESFTLGNASLGGLSAISTQTIGSTTYLFTTGTNSSNNGILQVYSLNKLISGDNTALLAQQDDINTIRLDNTQDIETTQKDNIVYAYISSLPNSEANSYFQELSFNPISAAFPNEKTWESPKDSTAVWLITDGTKSFTAATTEASEATDLYNFNITDPTSSSIISTSTSEDGSNVFFDDVNQLSSLILNNKYYYIAPNAGSTNKGIEAIEVNMSTGALTAKGSIAIDGVTDITGATFSSLNGATDFASFTIGSSVYGLVTAKTDQAIQILRLVDTSIISSATYDHSSGTLVVTGEDLVAQSGTDNDIDVSKLTFSGEDNSTYTLTSNDVELTSSSEFSITLNAADQLQLSGLLNKDGTSSGATGCEC